MNQPNPFAPLGNSEGVDLKTLNGSLLVLDVLGYETGINTTFGEKDAVRVNIGVVDGPRGGEQVADSLLFGGNLIGRLKGLVGQKTCGRLAQGQPKPGQQPPWMLLDPTDADIAAAAQFVTYQASQQLGGQQPAAAVQQAPGGYVPPVQGGYQPPAQGGYEPPRV